MVRVSFRSGLARLPGTPGDAGGIERSQGFSEVFGPRRHGLGRDRPKLWRAALRAGLSIQARSQAHSTSRRHSSIFVLEAGASLVWSALGAVAMVASVAIVLREFASRMVAPGGLSTVFALSQTALFTLESGGRGSSVVAPDPLRRRDDRAARR
ncbi:hypothetical protein GIY30_14780 [Gordonia sp. HNM0687]|uniref:Uncharacterized protein n=1 Tax=Gordonia mangrovi TaxID=2665643 RepID=A0A6L7GVC1_9ACTN|nr:hypothetical protein [Gordonia mangrovi]MXP22605.1 hypothetical protein [Gordonia mangrovi]UVF77525.1 hypothetical protein NWF22_19950 [Gordonia mangrovi]